MQVADGRDYVRFQYARVTTLRGRLFRQALEAAAREGRLPADIAILSEQGAQLREGALAPQGEGGETFEIDFAQMPRLVALIDFMHNALGFTVVADLLGSLLGPGPTASADEVSRKLQAALNAWLSARLESAGHILQAQRMRAFLACRGRVVPESVDDEAILLFWTAVAEAADDERIDGLRLFRSAASAMLRYRQALRDAGTARHLEDSLGRGSQADGELALDLAQSVVSGINSWRSPLSALTAEPAARIKWLTAKEQQLLFNFLGGPAAENEAAEHEDEEEPAGWKGGLADDERFDLAFWLTLLRADVFGSAQASIVARLRKRVSADAAIDQAVAPIDDWAYAKCAAAYADLRGQLQLECLAALAALMEAGAAEAVILLDHLGGAEAVGTVLGPAFSDMAVRAVDVDLPDPMRRQMAIALKAAIADPGALPEGLGRKMLGEALAATRKVSRAGFRREDRANAEMLAALRAGAAAVFDLVQELDRLTALLPQKAAAADLAGDRARFLASFQRMYVAGGGG